MYNKLLELKKKDMYVSVYNDAEDNDSFRFGKIDAVDEEFLLLRAYTPTGAPNGLYMLPLAHIIRIEYGDPYSERMKLLTHAIEEQPGTRLPGMRRWALR